MGEEESGREELGRKGVGEGREEKREEGEVCGGKEYISLRIYSEFFLQQSLEIALRTKALHQGAVRRY